MSKTKTKKNHITMEARSLEDRVLRALYNLRFKDLQKECVMRAMPFEDVVKASHSKLTTFFTANFERPQDNSLLAQYDGYVEDLLRSRGHKKEDAMLSPSLRLGYTKEIADVKKLTDPSKPAAIPKENKKPKAEVDEKTGVRKGTKKALTYELTLAGEKLDAVVAKVKAAFTEAEEKSIKIWYKRALKEKK